MGRSDGDRAGPKEHRPPNKSLLGSLSWQLVTVVTRSLVSCQQGLMAHGPMASNSSSLAPLQKVNCRNAPVFVRSSHTILGRNFTMTRAHGLFHPFCVS